MATIARRAFKLRAVRAALAVVLLAAVSFGAAHWLRSSGQYGVVGNGRILRLPRAERDLNAIEAALHAKYVVLGQVQSNGSQTRILAHLIRMADQTHLWVVRVDRTVTDPLRVESEVAQHIADQFSPRVAADASGASSPAASR